MRAREKEFVIAVVDDETALCEALPNLLRAALGTYYPSGALRRLSEEQPCERVSK